MSKARVYYSGGLKQASEVTLAMAASHHLQTVLRLGVGDSLTVFNGRGKEYAASVLSVSKKHVTISVGVNQEVERESPLKITLAQGISRGDRMDYALQKAVELGVHSIQPLFTERCGVKLTAERLQKRMQHWQAVVIGACEQSGRLLKPDILPPMIIDQWLNTKMTGLKLACVPDARSDKAVLSKELCVTHVTILVGPEGGLTKDEITGALTQGFLSFNLGPRILRTETAAVAAMTVLQLRWGDMGS